MASRTPSLARQVDPSLDESSSHSGRPRPSTLSVLGLLVAAAGIVSYLGAYAVVDTLVKAEVIARWPDGSDPRFAWFVTGFVSLLGGFAVLGGWMRLMSARHLRRIDQMHHDD